ncbi:MAG TPA: glycosyltransferase [Opitutus sp.]|nr:glycosyltransferase [Opitutus sp.]
MAARILVLHPVLGTGGGSRWSLQAAEALAARGHDVTWVTSAPRGRAPEWRELAIGAFRREYVAQAWPESVADRGRAFLANRRMSRLIDWCEANVPASDAVLMDGVPFAIPRARAAFSRSRIVFYCHFPEMLYAKREAWYLRWHRRHWIRSEREGLGAADCVLANSHYTLDRLLAQFPELASRAAICRPAVATIAVRAKTETPRHVLCVARWAPEKNLPLAVRAFAAYRTRASAAGATPLPLVIAGGFDAASRAAHKTFAAVEDEIRRAGFGQDSFRLLRDPSDPQLDELYRGALALVHPAPQEHFGMIAPEAMARGVPVIGIAGRGGGESVSDGDTGWLVAPDAAEIADRLVRLQVDASVRVRFGIAARRHAERFLIDRVGADLEAALFPPLPA